MYPVQVLDEGDRSELVTGKFILSDFICIS